MSKCFLFISVLIFPTVIFSQPQIPTRAPDDTTYFTAVEEMPELIGGVSSLTPNLYYSKEALKDKIEGRVYMLIYINEKGSVDKIKILSGLGYGLDEIASDAVHQAKFKPGRQDGIPVKAIVSLPIIFKLD